MSIFVQRHNDATELFQNEIRRLARVGRAYHQYHHGHRRCAKHWIRIRVLRRGVPVSDRYVFFPPEISGEFVYSLRILIEQDRKISLIASIATSRIYRFVLRDLRTWFPETRKRTVARSVLQRRAAVSSGILR